MVWYTLGDARHDERHDERSNIQLEILVDEGECKAWNIASLALVWNFWTERNRTF